MKASAVSAVSIAALAVGLTACSKQQQSTPDGSAVRDTTAPMGAIAEIMPTQGNQARGSISFTEEAGGVRVVANLTGLTPGEHGFHVHETGDCSAPDASSAGGHYNPDSMVHGGPESATRHVGDLGNIVADSTGAGHYDRVDPRLSLRGEHSIIGRAVIVHASVDDLTSQPAGNAGARVACGMITAH